MVFTEHGKFTIENHVDYLIVDATGPFNIELMYKFEKILIEQTNILSGRSWNQIIIMNEESLFTPEAEAYLCNTLAYRTSNGLAGSVIVQKKSLYSALIKEQLSRCYSKFDIAYTFVESLDEAKEWVNIQK
jgi:hypothetical protein